MILMPVRCGLFTAVGDFQIGYFDKGNVLQQNGVEVLALAVNARQSTLAIAPDEHLGLGVPYPFRRELAGPIGTKKFFVICL